jgi:hypothetical protein
MLCLMDQQWCLCIRLEAFGSDLGVYTQLCLGLRVTQDARAARGCAAGGGK